MATQQEIPIPLWPYEIETLADWHREQARAAAERENYNVAVEHKKRYDELTTKLQAALLAHLNPPNVLQLSEPPPKDQTQEPPQEQ